MVKLRTIQEWQAAMPRCCLNCDHYLTHRGEWEEGASCKVFGANPPREFAEAENECASWAQLIPF